MTMIEQIQGLAVCENLLSCLLPCLKEGPNALYQSG